jgi:hypothetical protein
MDSDERQINGGACYSCGMESNIFKSAGEPIPDHLEPGDVVLTVCARCGAVMALDDRNRLRQLTAEEIRSIERNPAIRAELLRALALCQMSRSRSN